MKLRVATRGSALARWQADHVAALLRAVDPGLDVEIVVVETGGDRRLDVPIWELGGKGVFVKEIQTAVLEGHAHVAVHSAKDLPSATPDGLVIAGVPERADVRDALVGGRLADLPEGAVVATGSLRRRAQLAHARPDLRFEGVRGNMATRVDRAGRDGVDAVVVAAAALDRLGWAERIAERLDVDVVLPQVGQAALAVECRADDDDIRCVLERVEHGPTRRAVDAERGFLAELGGDCSLPAAAHATIAGDGLRIRGLVATVDGATVVRHEVSGPATAGAALGRSVARHLLDEQGGAALLGPMTVHLVGAGPGDPGLLTVRALDVLRRADVVVYDRLSQESLLDLAPPGAERIDVGKAPGHVRLSQDDINALLVERGQRGDEVVRLKGGDPFVFARGGEEAAALAAAGVPFEVVPGITSAIAVPAYAGIPVTLRHSSTSVTIVTGHEDPAAGEDGSVDWSAVARVGGTIVILMGVARIRRIAAALVAGGRSPDTPVAAVQWGTRPEQRTVRATLGTIGAQALGTPSTIVVGDVAASDLAWFENRPLMGRRVVVTRAREQASELVARLSALGAATVEVPAIAIADPDDGGAALAAAVEDIGGYDWVVLTSPNGARRLLAALEAAGRDARALGGVGLAAIGPGTAAALASARLVPDLVPERFVAESLLASFPAPPAGGGRVLLTRAAVARDVLPEGLAAAGWTVDVVDAYRTDAVPLDERQAAALAEAEIVTFTSSSTVTNLLAAADGRPLPPVVAAIGPVTAATARAHGLGVDVEAEVHTIDGLVDALLAWAADHPGKP